MRNGRVMTLADAQRLGLARVDRKGKQSTKEYSAFRSNIELAVNKGILDARGVKLSLEEAIRQRLLDIRELKVGNAEGILFNILPFSVHSSTHRRSH